MKVNISAEFNETQMENHIPVFVNILFSLITKFHFFRLPHQDQCRHWTGPHKDMIPFNFFVVLLKL